MVAGHCWRSRDKLIKDVLLWTPHMAVQKQDDQHKHTFSSYVRIRDIVLKTCLGWWTIGRSGERGSGISVLPARHDDDDDNGTIINIHTYVISKVNLSLLFMLIHFCFSFVIFPGFYLAFFFFYWFFISYFFKFNLV